MAATDDGFTLYVGADGAPDLVGEGGGDVAGGGEVVQVNKFEAVAAGGVAGADQDDIFGLTCRQKAENFQDVPDSKHFVIKVNLIG